jgi:hypothetical protein
MRRLMTIVQFEDLTLTWGADVAKWPPDRRAAALELMSAEPAATDALLDSARRLDATLGLATAITASTGLRARITAAAPTARPWIDLAPWRGWFGAAAGAVLAASCAAGILVGLEAASHGLTPTGAQVAGDPAIEAAQLLRGPADQVEG